MRGAVMACRSWRWFALGLLVTSSWVAGQEVPESCREALSACAADPANLLGERVYRDLITCSQETRSQTMSGLASNSDLSWSIRARALTMLRSDRNRAAYEGFARDFVAARVAAEPGGAEAVNFLAAWLPRKGPEGELVGRLLMPGEAMSGVGEVLTALAGQPAHDYLRLLHRERYQLAPGMVRALAETDDQDTRRFLLWYVGEQGMAGMEPFLVGHIAADRPSSYPSQVRRTFEALFTAGLSELIRAAERVPPWLGPESTPKGMALRSLATLLPPGQAIDDRSLVEQLLAAAVATAQGKDRGQWQLAGDILLFLADRGEDLGPAGSTALGHLARNSLRKRGPLEAFSLAEEVQRRGAAALPALSQAERERLWEITLTTLDARFLAAVVRAYPSPDREQQLRQHLLAMAERAARGSLRVVRCWGADLQGPGEWCECVAELGILEAVDGVEGVLDTAWADEAALALTRLGADGAQVLTRFLLSPAAARLDGEVRRVAIRHLAGRLQPAAARQLLADLRARPATEDAAREVGRELVQVAAESE